MTMIGRMVTPQAANILKARARIAKLRPIAPAPLPEREMMNREWLAGGVNFLTGGETITPFNAMSGKRRMDGVIFKAVVDPGFDGSSLFVIVPRDDADIANGTGGGTQQCRLDLAPRVDPHQAALTG